MLDLVLRGGSVVDGTGRPAHVADVGVLDDRVVAIGDDVESGRREVDVSDLVVAPGFVDIHTHYDAQILWDPLVSPSSLHGVTTIIGGNCGFTIAPMASEHADYLARMLANVEGVPLESLRHGPDWTWQSWADWFGHMDGQLGVNAGFLVGHSTVRRLVMGEHSIGDAADAAQIEGMARLLHECLAAGGMGFSSSWGPAHFDGDSNPVPSRFAELDELVALAAVAGEHPGTVLEFAPGIPGEFGDREVDAMIAMSRAANRSVNWNVLRVQERDAGLADELLSYGSRAEEQQARVIALTFPDLTYKLVTLSIPNIWASVPGWEDVMRLPEGPRIERLKDPAVRAQLRTSARRAQDSPNAVFASLMDFASLRFVDSPSPANADIIGRTVGEVATSRGADTLDVLLDVAIADDLATYFEMSFAGEDAPALWRKRRDVWLDPRAILGGSDAGAHVDSACGATYTTALLGGAVRERELLALEEAVRLLTDVPARFYGLKERGRVMPGWHADLTVFDPTRIGGKPIHFVSDLPGGARRLFADADGVEHVFVNGVEILRAGEQTGDRPGTLLRSDRDIETTTAA